MWDLIGLAQCDESVYRYYIGRPGSTSEEISRATGLQQSVVDSSRVRLIDLGLLRLEPSGDVWAVPNGPAMVMEMVRNDLHAEYARKRSDLAQIESELTRLTNAQILAASSEQGPHVDWVPSSDAMAMRVTELMCHARTEVAWVDPGSVMPWKAQLERAVPAEVRAAQRGVDVRVICPWQPSGTVRQRPEDTDRGSPIRKRVMSTPEIELLIFDRRIAMLAGGRWNGGQNALLVREKLLVHMLYRVFEAWWAQATDLRPVHTHAGQSAVSEVNSEEKLILRMLGDGYKDETIAKKLGISVRTVRRKISCVLQRMSAESRFQAGVQAAQRGWILYLHRVRSI